jgi:hypothetical protein
MITALQSFNFQHYFQVHLCVLHTYSFILLFNPTFTHNSLHPHLSYTLLATKSINDIRKTPRRKHIKPPKFLLALIPHPVFRIARNKYRTPLLHHVLLTLDSHGTGAREDMVNLGVSVPVWTEGSRERWTDGDTGRERVCRGLGR